MIYQTLARLGYEPIPLVPGEKRPRDKNWTTRAYDYKALDERASPNESVGVRTGRTHAIDIDIMDPDCAQAIEACVRKHIGKSSPTRIGKAPKRMLFYTTYEPLPKRTIMAKKGEERGRVELLGLGQQFVAHGIHPDTGKPYTWSKKLPAFDKLKRLNPTALQAMIDDIVDVCDAHGWTAVTDAIAERKVTGKFRDQRWDQYNVDLVTKKLAVMDPNMEYPEWMQVGMSMHAGFHGEEEGYELFHAWSKGELHGEQPERYKGPKPCSKLWYHTKAGRGINTGTFFAIAAKYERLAGIEPDTTVRRSTSVLGVGTGLSADGAAIGDSMLTGAVAETVWYIRSMLTNGAVLLVGRPKGGKSWLVMDMVNAYVNGGDCCGFEASPGGDVLWISAEDDAVSLKRRVHMRGIKTWSGRKVHVFDGDSLEASRVKDLPLVDWVQDYLVAHPTIRVAFIDTQNTAEAIWGVGDTQRSVIDDAYERSRRWQRMALAQGVCIVLVHHTRKRNGKMITDYHELVNMAQTIVAGAAASIVIADHPDRDVHDDADMRRIVAVRGRHTADSTTVVELMPNFSFKAHGNVSVVAQTDAQIELMEAVEACMEDGAEWVTIAQIASYLGKHRNSIGTIIRRMRKTPSKMLWKDKVLTAKQGKGLRLASV